MSSDTGQDELRQKVVIYMSLFERADRTDEMTMREAVDGVMQLIAAEVAKGRIDEDWKIREQVTLHHYDTTTGRRIDEFLEAHIAELQSLAGQDEGATK